MDTCKWEKSFSNVSLNEKVVIFNKTILNTLSNNITPKTIKIDDKDPPWLYSRIET